MPQNHVRLCASLRVNSAPAPNYMARKLAPLKQSSPNSRIRYRGSAAPEGGGDNQETNQVFKPGGVEAKPY